MTQVPLLRLHWPQESHPHRSRRARKPDHSRHCIVHGTVLLPWAAAMRANFRSGPERR